MRQARLLRDGVPYHVTARTNWKESILNSTVSKELFLETVAMAMRKHDFRLDNFVIVGNHFTFSSGRKAGLVSRRS